MRLLPLLATICLGLSSCDDTPRQWHPTATIELGTVTPIGLAYYQNQLWIADGDHNQLVAIDDTGQTAKTATDFERPMHIDAADGALYIPEYGSDQIIVYRNGQKSVLPLADSLDAPAGVSVFGEQIAIADFYNHRIVYFDGKVWSAFGQEGKGLGSLYYPTDVQILSDKIVVADAYNNRIQVFDKAGKATRLIGEADGMNAATGLYADDAEIWVTDFENDRVLRYDHDGKLLQTISEGLQKPTDILKVDNELYIANYKGNNLIVYNQK